ncbi:signal recognition particle-docking protein FtsY [Plectonema cf. radiosum LEGE 06105]|uniref:Signal recognition particle receptor FtsY n=1 Tax=Plectonema cf. radiosum LEGE 06105 TaxID=945769 RepID=A0A8J7F6E6_9CYAN|nr:signal recognition particle-docking protein FtsY [Plectonema radiosum]MBE9216270.1 signal recognition particle-docking protein FtsY [Plectonema cf. radiosum LEGE 06105]
MVFNWFRRQNNKSSDTSSEQKQEQTAVEKEVSTESTETQTPQSPTTEATDLLAFAKAAYKNIQEKQQTTASTEQSTSEISVEEVTESPQELTETVIESEEVTESPQEVTQTVTESEEVVEETIATTTSAVETSDADATGQQIISELETANVSEPIAPANLSFLEKAALEREAKQERLIASAIDIENSRLESAAKVADDTNQQIEQISELAFDEGFLWSTEVLAAQGRRAEDVSIEEITWLQKLRQGLDKTRRSLINQLKAIVGKGPLNADAVEQIEALLLQADVGVEATDFIINSLQEKLRQEALPPEEGIAYLKKILRDILDKPLQDSSKFASFTPEKETFNIWLMTGVNGAGKTTTIGKIAHLANKSGYKCLIGAADTFRAAAVQQVKVWGERSGVEVIANPGKNTDPAAVVFDAIAAAQSRETELLLVDTAGRLQNKKNLMEELSKIRRIIHKKAPDAKVESLLVLDATLGQNGLRQAEVFSQAAELSGVVLTKLDGTAKGGVALAVVQQLGLPIRFIGAGEGIEDLRPFSSYEFVEALLSG